MPTWVLSSSRFSVMHFGVCLPLQWRLEVPRLTNSLSSKDLLPRHKVCLFVANMKNTLALGQQGSVFREEHFTQEVLLNLGGFTDLVDFVILKKGLHKGRVRLWPMFSDGARARAPLGAGEFQLAAVPTGSLSQMLLSTAPCSRESTFINTWLFLIFPSSWFF